MSQCILCAQECQFIGISECNHEPMCFRCIYKMRVISKNNSCPICKTQSKYVIVNHMFSPFHSFKQNLLPDKNFSDIFYTTKQAKQAFQKLTQYKCFYKAGNKLCKNQKKFPSIAFLKKHLKEQHNRYICDVCLDKKTCVLEEQKLYSLQQLNRHVQRGDLDQCSNVTFLHPYCKFCNKYFFDEDQFRLHINIEHIKCNVCGPQYKYRFYKNYDSLEIHFKISHYICSDPTCLSKKFIAFKNSEELRIHKLQFHDKSAKRVELKQMCGFISESQQGHQQRIQIKDNEGVDMQIQFLSLKKTKNRALGQADQQIDKPFDIRDFFHTQMNENDHFNEAFILKHHQTKQIQQQQQKPKQPIQHKKRKYVSKQQIEKEKPIIAKENQHFILEDIQLIQTLHLPKISPQEFENNLQRIINDQKLKEFVDWKYKLTKGKIKPQQFLKNFMSMMKPISLKSAYHIFPHFIRTIQNEQLKIALDQQFLKALKHVETKSDSLLIQSQNYSDFFHNLTIQIEKNIQSRIVQKKISIKNPIKKNKQRLFQIMGVVRRLKIQEMAKFKFASNFGLQKDTMQYLMERVFKLNKSNIQKRLFKITQEELLDLYVFVKYCSQAIKHSKGVQLEKSKIHEQILEDFLYQRPHLQQQFGKKKNQLSLEQQIQFEGEQEQKKLKKQMKDLQVQNKKRGYTAQTDYNLGDKSDFPDLMLSKSDETQEKKQQFKQLAKDRRQKPATYQKKMNELFPTLEAPEQKVPSKTEVKKSSQEQKKEQKAWWQKLNQKKYNDDDVQMVEVKKKGKGKKKVEWVKVTGLFN